MLDYVQDSLSAIADRNGVCAIVSKWEIHGSQSNCGTVDVTNDIVNLFNPDKRMLKIIQEMADREPIKDAFFIEN